VYEKEGEMRKMSLLEDLELRSDSLLIGSETMSPLVVDLNTDELDGNENIFRYFEKWEIREV